MPVKVYPLSSRDREVVDKCFDKLHEQQRMIWSNRSTAFGFPTFVVWRKLDDGANQRRTGTEAKKRSRANLGA